MKRIQVLILAISLITAMAMAAETNVSSVNVVGYTKVNIPSNGGLALISLPFESISGVPICVSNLLTGNPAMAQGSAAFVWNRSARTYVNASVTRSGWSGPGYTNVVMRGDAFWLKNGSTSNDYVAAFSGEVPDSTLEGTTTVNNVGGPATAFGYPYPADIYFTNTVLYQNSVQGDTLSIWSGTTYNNYSKTRSGWSGASPMSNLVVRLGQGFWFSTTNAAVVSWTETVPYNLH